jgi:hypothetical protein
MKVGGYNIMKHPISQGVVKSICVLVNGNKICAVKNDRHRFSNRLNGVQMFKQFLYV